MFICTEIKIAYFKITRFDTLSAAKLIFGGIVGE